LTSARNNFARAIRLRCNGQSNGARLKEILGPYRNGTCPVSIVYNNATAEVEVLLGDDWKVNLQDGLLQSLGKWIKPNDIEIVYS
jgi:DNA polymerase-3 subunit alpha